MKNIRKAQLRKFYKSLNHNRLAEWVYNLFYDYDYVTELFEYDENERQTDYATNHAHDYASRWNDLDDFYSRDVVELWDDYKYISMRWTKWEQEGEVL